MEGLQNPSAPNCVLFGDTFSKKLAAIQQEQVTYTPNDTAFSAMAMAVAYIVLRSAPKIIVGEDMVIRNLSGAEEIKRAAMCYAFSLFIYLTFSTAFMDAGLVSKDCES